MTAAISSVTGVSIFISGLVLIGLMRVVMMAALFLIFEAPPPARIAVLATVLYAANPNFVFFNAQWAYESFSLPIALVAVALAARAPWSQWDARTRAALGRFSLRTVLVPLLIVLTVAVLASDDLLRADPVPAGVGGDRHADGTSAKDWCADMSCGCWR